MPLRRSLKTRKDWTWIGHTGFWFMLMINIYKTSMLEFCCYVCLVCTSAVRTGKGAEGTAINSCESVLESVYNVTFAEKCSQNASGQQHHLLHTVILSKFQYKCSCLSRTSEVHSVHNQWKYGLKVFLKGFLMGYCVTWWVNIRMIRFYTIHLS
jgi:hypothetical protein